MTAFLIQNMAPNMFVARVVAVDSTAQLSPGSRPRS